MSERADSPGGDDAEPIDAPTVESPDPFVNLPNPRRGLEIRSPYPTLPPDADDDGSPGSDDAPEVPEP